MRIVDVLLCLALTGCCSGPDYLSFALVRHSGPDNTFTGSTAPRWGEVETMKVSDEIEMIFETESTLSVDALELYDSQGMRTPFAGADRLVPSDGEACEHNERRYELDTLAAGMYQLVHRRKHGTGDPLNCVDLECPWTTFEGDEAVTLMLVLE